MDAKAYILQERARGVPDKDIVASLQAQGVGAPEANTSRNFVQEIIPTAGAVLGGIGGAIAGFPLGGPAGSFAGGVAGASAGGALGETIEQQIEQLGGQRKDLNVGQIVGTGVGSGAVQAIGGGVARLGGIAGRAVQPSLVKFLGSISGYAEDVVSSALKRTPNAVEGTRLGEAGLNNIIVRANGKIQELASAAVNESRKAIAEFSKLSGGGAGFPGARQTLLQEGSRFVQNTINTLRQNYKIGVSKDGLLSFDRAVMPSNIVSRGDQSAIQSAWDAVRNIQKDTSIKQIDAVLERLITLKTKTPGGTPTGGETKKIIGEMMGEVQKFASSLGKYGQGYADYVKFIEQNIPKRVLLQEAKDLFGSSRNLTPSDTSLIAKRLLRLYNTGMLAAREGVEELGTKIGEDVTGGVAGTIIKTGKQVIKEATIPTPRGIVEKLVEFIPREAIKSYITTGQMSGELLKNPALQMASNLTGISTKALLQEMANLLENKTTR